MNAKVSSGGVVGEGTLKYTGTTNGIHERRAVCDRLHPRGEETWAFRMAHAEGWARDQWGAALARLETKQWEQLQHSKMIDN